jgi:hypothetical protein
MNARHAQKIARPFLAGVEAKVNSCPPQNNPIARQGYFFAHKIINVLRTHNKEEVVIFASNNNNKH